MHTMYIVLIAKLTYQIMQVLHMVFSCAIVVHKNIEIS